MKISYDLSLNRLWAAPWWHRYRAGAGGLLPALVLENETGRLHGATRLNANTLDLSSLDLSQGFTLYARGKLDYTLGGGGFPRLVEIGSNTSNADRHTIYIRESSGKVQSDAIYAGVHQFLEELSDGVQPSGVGFRAAVRFMPNDYAGCWEGGSLKTDSAGSIPPNLTRLHLRASFGQTSVPGLVDLVVVWTGAVPNGALQAYAA